MNILHPTNYLKLTAAVLLLFGAGLIFVPSYVMRVLGIENSANGSLIMQFLGASLAGHSYLNWHTKQAEAQVIKPVMRMNIFALLLAIAISLSTIITNSYTKIGLLILVMHSTFLCGFVVVLRRMRTQVNG